MNPNKICFVSKDVYTLLTGEGNIGYGGSEIKVVNLIRAITTKNINVNVICRVPQNVTRKVEINGILIYPWRYPAIKIKYISTLIFCLRLIFLLHKVKATAFISQNANLLIFLTALYSRLSGKKFIHWISHYFDTLKTNRKGMNSLDFYFYRRGLKMSDITIVQTNEQKKSLIENYRKKSTLIRNGHDIIIKTNSAKKSHILWLGRLKKSKQPHLFINLANEFPTQHFIMAGAWDNSFPDYLKKISADIYRTKNLVYLGEIPYHEISSLFHKTLILVNTSIGEGFSNTLIEAWNHHVPVVTLNHDPDNCIKKCQLGFHSRNFDQMVKDVSQLIDDNKLRARMGDNGKKYIKQYHNIEDTSRDFLAILQNSKQ